MPLPILPIEPRRAAEGAIRSEGRAVEISASRGDLDEGRHETARADKLGLPEPQIRTKRSCVGEPWERDGIVMSFLLVDWQWK